MNESYCLMSASGYSMSESYSLMKASDFSGNLPVVNPTS